MPLSEDDQRRLDEIERALQRDAPKFAAGHPPSSGSGGADWSAGAVVPIGMVLLVAGRRRHRCWG
jgi:MYXO-CTERM domain-containing protein